MNQAVANNPFAVAQAAKAKNKGEKEAAATKAERKPRDVMSVVDRTKLGTLIEAEYVKSGLTDSEFATMASERIGRDVSPSTVASYREAYGFAAPPKMTLGEARARIRALEAELASARGTDA